MLRSVPSVYVPYLDHEVYDFLVSLSPEVMLVQGFHDKAIARAYPQWAGIGYEHKNVPDYDRASYYAAATRALAAKVLVRRLPRSLARWSANLRLLAALFDRRRAAQSYGYARRLLYLLQLFELEAGVAST
jgi:hypothetical protein